MEKIFEIVQASAALEGSSLTMAECERLLAEGISSEGKTIAEQLLCLNLRSAYEKCFRMAVDHEFWSVYRLKSLASVALRDSGAAVEIVSNERVLQKICDIANGMRLHIGGDDAMDQYKASFMIHYLVSAYKPWETGNDYIGRLLMNYLQHECRLQPTIIRPSKRAEYLRILETAKREEISEVFVSYMLEHCHDRAEKEDVVEPIGAGMAVRQQPAVEATASERREKSAPSRRPSPAPAKRSSRDAILALLRKNPYMSTRDLADEIGISAKGVEKQLGILKATDRLRRIGPDKGGKWEVVG
ncbi:MAG: winged helix-turn-helix transcriptional regulator [Bacteroidales bacterium]|nr:winged helix-turn-helix transcriptional regulator [Bacteroidales bacterium]